MSLIQSNCKRAVILLFAVYIPFLASCSREDAPKEYFESHGMSYPVDVSGVSIFAVIYVGIDEEELMAPGAREFIQEGIAHIKKHYHTSNVNVLIPGTVAMKVDKPVLYRADTEDVGLMVRLTAYGSGTRDEKLHLPVKWVVKDNNLWKVVNFAYFTRRGLYEWQYGGMVF